MGSGGGGAAGLEGDETRSVALASLPRQLISASCWRLAGRKCTPGGLALESCCSTSTEISDLRTGFIFFLAAHTHTRFFSAGTSSKGKYVLSFDH